MLTLRELREQRCITQVEMARQIGCSSQALSQWERGSNTSMKARRDLAKFFGLELAQMIEVLKETKRRGKLVSDLASVGA